MATTAPTATALHPRLVVGDGEPAIAFYVAALDGHIWIIATPLTEG